MVHETVHGKVSFTLRADCSGKNLTELPSISRFTVLLSVDRNQISDLSRLNSDPAYSNLHSLYANQNEVDRMDSLINSPFFARVQVLQLKQNRISEVSTSIQNPNSYPIFQAETNTSASSPDPRLPHHRHLRQEQQWTPHQPNCSRPKFHPLRLQCFHETKSKSPHAFSLILFISCAPCHLRMIHLRLGQLRIM